VSEAAPLLAGVRLVDCTTRMAGAVATLLLAESGAEVLKVRAPGTPWITGPASGHATWNRSKIGIELDITTGSGRDQLYDLLSRADGFVHDLDAGAAARLGLDDGSLLGRIPTLVVSGIPAWPNRHPWNGRAGDDNVVMARLGLNDEQLGHRAGPIFLRFPFASWGAAYLAAIGIVARLHVRAATGRGGVAHTSLAEGALSLSTLVWCRPHLVPDGFDASMAKDRPVALFECSDGAWLHVPYSNLDRLPLMIEYMARVGPEGVAAANRRRRPDRYLANAGVNEAAFRQYDSATWLTHLWEHDIAALRVDRLGTLLADGQARANGFVVRVHDPDLGPVEQAAVGYVTSPPPRVTGPAPSAGRSPQAGPAWAARPEPGPTTGTRQAQGRYPLAGLKVVDFGQYIAGPMGAMLLADLGADVVKVEPPAGDYGRNIPKAFVGCQRNKRSLVIDLRRPESSPVIDALARWADVVHHNMRLDAAARLGIDDDRLRAINPRLVYCHLSAYGHRGPRATWPGYDAVFQAAGGWELAAAGAGNTPQWQRFGMLDQLAGMSSVVATLLALRDRDRSGRGQMVHASLLGATVLTTSEVSLRPDGTLTPAPVLDATQSRIDAWHGLYETVDGWVMVGADGNAEQQGLLDAFGVSSPDELEAAARPRLNADLLEALERAHVAAEAVACDNLAGFHDLPAHEKARLTVAFSHPEYGMLDQPGQFWDFGDLDVRLDSAPPLLGEHNLAVLSDLGFNPDTIDELAASGVLGAATAR
jgi:crotonobetainyl-CoA:carnitine CoA-transferase CaiB-like acyl-CoA transferase